MRKILSFILAALIAVTWLPSHADAAEATGEFNFSLYGIPLIANRYNTLPSDYVPELVKVSGTSYRLEPETYNAYLRMNAAMWDAGLRQKLYIQSAYRSYSLQKTLFNNKVAKLRPAYGVNAEEAAATVVARPGQSEHQLGNTIDFSLDGSLTQSFGGTAKGMWLARNSHKYGFILRYPEGKSDITGVIYEPWHFRYVGVEIATYIFENDLTLEEYVELATR